MVKTIVTLYVIAIAIAMTPTPVQANPITTVIEWIIGLVSPPPPPDPDAQRKEVNPR